LDKIEPGLVAFYDSRPGNSAGLYCDAWVPLGAHEPRISYS